MRYVTAALVTGGFCGHRIKDQWTAKVAAYLWNLTYVHFPFPKDHLENNGRIPDETQWEPFLGFGDNEIQFGELDLSQLKIVRIDKTEWCGLDLDYVDSIIKAHPEDNTLFLFIESARIMLEQISELARFSIVTNLRNKYWNRRKAEPVLSYFHPNHLNVALHVRRGADVAPTGRAPWRATADSYYHGVIENIRNALPEFTVDFHIYSEGPAEIFESYKQIPNIFFHFCPWPPLDYNDLFTSFHHMITADILVTATSEFSYFVAHMNPNFTITLPVERVCELPQEWRHIKSKLDGSFDVDALRNFFQHKKTSSQFVETKSFIMPLYIHVSEQDSTSDIDKVLQWAFNNKLEPKIIKTSSPMLDRKFLQLDRPQQRIHNPQAVANFHAAHDFSRIVDASRNTIARNLDGSEFTFHIQ